jgi:hypothetical protein
MNMRINRSKLLMFYDSPSSIPDKDGRGSHVSAITGLIGEDLILGLLCHYFISQGKQIEILPDKCNQKKKRGKRLDAWVKYSHKGHSILYQTEVKNWSGHSLDGYDFGQCPTLDELRKFSSDKWNHYFPKKRPIAKEIAKVIEPMSLPPNCQNAEHRAMICFWSFVVPSFKEASFRPLNIAGKFNGLPLQVFSASAYLRSVKNKTLDIKMPRVATRLGMLSGLVSDDV